MNKLIVLVGLPRSGKDTWCKENKGDAVVVSPDAIRLALYGQRFELLAEDFVWAIAKVMVRALFIAGNEKVIVNATSITKKSRGQWLSPNWKTFYKVLDTPADICKQRAIDTKQEDLLPVIDRMVENFEPLDEDELKMIINL